MRGGAASASCTPRATDLARQMRERGYRPEAVKKADKVLDPNVLTLGFARRFTEYKRPNLLVERSANVWTSCCSTICGRFRLLSPARRIRPTHVGKEHDPGMDQSRPPAEDTAGKSCSSRTTTSRLAQEMVQGVDVWINTPRRPWEACGTSGMKVLVNGGINCSTLDGWWDEAYEPSVGWSIGDGGGGDGRRRRRPRRGKPLRHSREQDHSRILRSRCRRSAARLAEPDSRSMGKLTPVFRRRADDPRLCREGLSAARQGRPRAT